jgi:toxin ParE2
MIATILEEAERDLESVYDFYQIARRGLGDEFIEEFRRGVTRMLEHPNAWQLLDSRYRRCRLHRFPYAIIYRVDSAAQEIAIVAIMHLSRRPDWWRDRID